MKLTGPEVGPLPLVGLQLFDNQIDTDPRK
jgi:hypothetical protein